MSDLGPLQRRHIHSLSRITPVRRYIVEHVCYVTIQLLIQSCVSGNFNTLSHALEILFFSLHASACACVSAVGFGNEVPALRSPFVIESAPWCRCTLVLTLEKLS